MWRWRLQNKFPGFAGVSCLKQSAFAAVGPKVTACRHVCHVRFSWIDNDPSNRAAIFQSDVLPIFSAIVGAIDTVAPTGRVAIVRFTCSHPNHIRIGWSDGNGADGERGLLVEDRIERHAVVTRFENAAVREANVHKKQMDCEDRSQCPIYDRPSPPGRWRALSSF